MNVCHRTHASDPFIEFLSHATQWGVEACLELPEAPANPNAVTSGIYKGVR
jgi:hypothetical protein